MKTMNRSFIIWLALSLAFMALIFFKSNEPYKQQDIRPFLKQYVHLTNESLPSLQFHYDKDLITTKSPYEFLEFWIRKAGHVTEYALLTFLWFKTFTATRLTRKTAFLMSGVLSFLYACTDEWHQTFVSGRTGHPIDVFIPDTFGILLSIFLIFIAARLTSRN